MATPIEDLADKMSDAIQEMIPGDSYRYVLVLCSGDGEAAIVSRYSNTQIIGILHESAEKVNGGPVDTEELRRRFDAEKAQEAVRKVASWPFPTSKQ